MKVINYQVAKEKLVSRVNGLFAYLDTNEYGEVVLHQGNDADGGCHGKYVENILIPDDINLTYNGVVLISGGTTISYNTMMYYYYKFYDVLPHDEGFMEFVNVGIGKIMTPQKLKEKYRLIPDVIFLSNVKRMYNDIVSLKKLCENYTKKRKDKQIDEDTEICCQCEKYKNMGGDKYVEYLKTLSTLCDEVSETYYDLAKKAKTKNSLMFDVDLTSTYDDIGVVNSYIQQWLPYKTYFVGDEVFYDGEIYVCVKETSGAWVEKENKVVFDFDCFNKKGKQLSLTEKMKLSGRTDSKLKDLRRTKTFYNLSNSVEIPQHDEDWLYYYRVRRVMNIVTEVNEFGNIISEHALDDGKKIAATSKDDLYAYGDIIEKIEYNKDEQEIKFIYRLGVKLKSSDDAIITTDDDRNEIYNWGSLVWDGNEKVGMKYEEKYNYLKGGDLDLLINGEYKLTDENGVEVIVNFDDYIKGVYDNILKHTKFEFLVVRDDETNIFSLTKFETYRENYDEFVEAKTFRPDYYIGLTFTPKMEHNVKINRGSSSAFQKHIAFGEIKTVDDMTNYKNGSFFRFSNS